MLGEDLERIREIVSEISYAVIDVPLKPLVPRFAPLDPFYNFIFYVISYPRPTGKSPTIDSITRITS